MALVDDLTVELAAAQAAIDAMKATLADVDYFIALDNQSAGTPAATRAARQSLRATLAANIAAAEAAMQTVKTRAAAADPPAGGYASGLSDLRAELTTGALAATDATYLARTAAMEAAISAEAGVARTLADVQAALDTPVTGIDTSVRVDPAALDAAAAVEVAARATLDQAIALVGAHTAAMASLRASALTAAGRLGGLIAMAQQALEADRPWQAAVLLADAEKERAALTGALSLSAPGFDADNVAANPGALWTASAQAALTAIGTWKDAVNTWAIEKNDWIEQEDRRLRYLDGRLVQAAEKLEAVLTP